MDVSDVWVGGLFRSSFVVLLLAFFLWARHKSKGAAEWLPTVNLMVQSVCDPAPLLRFSWCASYLFPTWQYNLACSTVCNQSARPPEFPDSSVTRLFHSPRNWTLTCYSPLPQILGTALMAKAATLTCFEDLVTEVCSPISPE